MRSTGIWALALTSLLSTQAFAVELPGKGVTVKPLQSTIAEESEGNIIRSHVFFCKSQPCACTNMCSHNSMTAKKANIHTKKVHTSTLSF